MKISQLYIHSFRGIPTELSLDFTDKKGSPLSVILYGDNGTGKSSVVDAIELCLQARIARSEVLRNPLRPSVLTYQNQHIIGSEIRVTFDDSSQFVRGITVTYKNGMISYDLDNKIIHPSFSLAPIALRRNDIYSYGMIPREQRQVLFFKFLYHNIGVSITDFINHSVYWKDDPVILNLKDKYLDIKAIRKDYIDRLETVLGIERNDIPFGANKYFSNFIQECLGRRPKVGKNKGYKSPTKSYNFKKRIIIKELYDKIFNLNEDLYVINKSIKQALNPSKATVEEQKGKILIMLKKASVLLTDAFRTISTADYVDSISLSLGKESEVSMDISICLINGRKVYPHQIFSEANYDLMVLLLYISLIRVCVEEEKQSKVLILDDVLQSVDATIRMKFVNYILDCCKDWQLLFTTHDRLWLEQLKYSFARHGILFKALEMTNWNFQCGPTVIEKNNFQIDDKMGKAIATGDNTIIASVAGVTLENICQQLSFSLSITMKRRYEDKYTIGDIWPGLCKILKRTNLKDLVEQIDSLLLIRNLLGCHANEWAKSLSDTEIFEFAHNIKELYDRTFCPKCMKWIALPATSTDIIAECSCRCIQYKWSKNKNV